MTRRTALVLALATALLLWPLIGCATEPNIGSEETSGKQPVGCFGSGTLWSGAPNINPNTKIAFEVIPAAQSSASAIESASARQTVGLSPRPGEQVRGICVMNADGTDIMQVVNTGSSPAWTADGKKLSFLTEDEISNEIYIMNADGSHRTKLAWPEGLPPQINIAPSWPMSWSPDGTRIAFQSGCDIYVMRTDGSSEATRLTTDAAWGCAQSPTWSPDSTQIAFTSTPGNSGVLNTPSDLYIIDVSRKGANAHQWRQAIDDKGITHQWRQLTDDTAGFFNLSWSPDGTKIAFNRGGRSQGMYTVDVNSLKETRLTHTLISGESPTWSPDGKKIAYSNDGDIYVMNADGSNSTSVAYIAGADARSPAWQPLP
jgi:TolB protein